MLPFSLATGGGGLSGGSSDAGSGSSANGSDFGGFGGGGFVFGPKTFNVGSGSVSASASASASEPLKQNWVVVVAIVVAGLIAIKMLKK